MSKLFYFKCAIVKKSTSTGEIIHDGFLPFTCSIQSPTDPDFINRIMEIYPSIDSYTKLFTIDEHGDKIVAFLSEHSQVYDFVQWLTRNYSPGAIIKIYIEDPVVKNRASFISSHDSITEASGMIFQPDVSEATALKDMVEKLYLEMKGVKNNHSSLHQQVMKAAEGKDDVTLDFHLRIEKLLNANINATANLQNKMELLKNVIESSLSFDWKSARQEQVISNWIDVTREAEKWKNGNSANFPSHQTSSSFSYDGQQELLNNLQSNSMRLYKVAGSAGSASDYGISSDNSEGSRIQPYRSRSRGLQTYF